MLLNVVVLLSFIATFAVCANGAEISAIWSEKDVNKVLHKLRSTAQTSASSREIYHSIELLKDYPDFTGYCTCKTITSAAASAQNALEWFMAKSSSDACGCDVEVSAALLDNLEAKFTGPLDELVGALLLGENTKRLSEETLAKGLRTLRDALTVNGELKVTLNNAQIVLDALVGLRGEAQAAPLIAELAGLAQQLLPTGNGQELSDATLLSSLSLLSEKKVRLNGAQLAVVADALVPLKHADDAETLHRALDSLSRVKTYKNAPLHVTQKQGVLLLGESAQHALEIEVRDVLGGTVAVEEIEVLSIKVSGKDTVFGEGIKVSGPVLSLSELQLTTGRYLANLSVKVSGKSTPLKYQGVFAVVNPVSVSQVCAAVTDNKKTVASDLPAVKQPNTFTGAAAASAQQVVHVSFTVSPTTAAAPAKKPHQAFVKFTNVQSGLSVLAVATAKRSAGDDAHFEYTSALSLGEELERFDRVSGEYTVSILVGDATFAEPLEWVVGSVSLQFPPKPVVNLPLYAKSLLHTSDNTLTALPEIEHQMRPPAKRASDFMATVFTALTVLPLLVFIGFNVSLKPNFAYLRSLTSIAFVVCLAATLALYAGYWLAIEGLTFYKTIKYLAFSLPVTLFLGYQSLQSVIKARESAAKQK